MQMMLVGAGVGVVVGAVIGYLIGFLGQKKYIAHWQGRHAETEKRLEATKRDASAQLETERGRVADSEKKLVDAKAKISEQEKSIEQQRLQLKQAQTALQDVEAARLKAVTQVEAAGNARVQAEGRCKQAETMAAQGQRALAQAEGQLKGAVAEIESFKQAGERHAKELQRLRSELTAAKHATSNLEEAMDAFDGSDGSLDGVLTTLMELEGQKAAVLADANGIIVAGVGDPKLREGMAATSQLVGSLCTQLVDMVPFSSVRSYYLQDTQSNVIAGRAFMCSGETVGLATYGPRVPSDRHLDGAMANLSAILE
jgi:hypothetical protein